MAEKLLTVGEVAQRLRMRPETVRVWLREGRLRGTRLRADKLGWRVPEAEVERVLDTASTTPSPPADALAARDATAAAREALHALLDALPPQSLAGAARLLRLQVGADSELPPVLRDAPIDDEPATDEDRAAMAEAYAAIAAGRTVSHTEARRRLLGTS